MKEIKSGIYIIFNIENKKIYFGSSKDLYSRERSHFNNLKANRHCNKKLQNDFNKYGEESFKFYIIKYVENDKQKLFKEEQFFLDLFLNNKPELLYNIEPIAGSTRLRQHDIETRKKMSKSHTGIKVKIKRIVSEETKKKLSIINKGKKLSKETCEKISIAHKGKSKPKPKGEESWMSKLTEEDVRNIKIRIKNESNLSKIARDFNIGTTQIYRIRDEEQWGWVEI